MSNITIKERILQDLNRLSVDSSFCIAFSKRLETNIVALEKMPYDLIRSGNTLAMQVLHSGWAIEEECSPDLLPLIAELQDWLSNVPD